MKQRWQVTLGEISCILGWERTSQRLELERYLRTSLNTSLSSAHEINGMSEQLMNQTRGNTREHTAAKALPVRSISALRKHRGRTPVSIVAAAPIGSEYPKTRASARPWLWRWVITIRKLLCLNNMWRNVARASLDPYKKSMPSCDAVKVYSPGYTAEIPEHLFRTGE
jgi:hypothetical protein